MSWMPDREKVIKELEAVLSRDPLDAPWDLIDETLELLKDDDNQIHHMGLIIEEHEKERKERPQIIRCKDCWKRGFDNCPFYNAFDFKPNGEWFCADGD